MSESTLKITFTELRTEVGRFLGLRNSDYSSWTDGQKLDVTACIKRGLRNFYFPPRTEQQPAHRWSFLRPRATFTIWDDLVTADAVTATISYSDPTSTVTASEAAFYPSMVGKSLVTASENSYTITGYTSSTVVTLTEDASGDTGDIITIDSEDTFTMPFDYAGMSGEGNFTYQNDENKMQRIVMTSDVNIRHLRQTTISTGTPYLVAISPKTTDGTQGQRWEAMFHRPPNDVLILEYRYYVLPDALVLDDLEYPYGSAAHSETILESCIAIAESREKDGGTGEHQARFTGLLQSSMDHDRSLAVPIVKFGYNRDGSDDFERDYYWRSRNNHCWTESLATFNA